MMELWRVYILLKCQLQNRIDEMFSGTPVNITEHRPVQHMALRTPDYLTLMPIKIIRVCRDGAA